MKNQIKNLKDDIVAIKDRIEEQLTFDFAKIKDSNHKYEKRENMITNIDLKYDKLNSELRNLMSRNKDQSLKKLLEKSNNISEIIRDTKEELKKSIIKNAHLP